MTAPINYDDVLDQVRGFGLIVDSLATGRIVRCRVEGEGRDKKGWYWLHDWVGNDGDAMLVGSFGIWHGNENNAQQINLKKRDLSPEDRAGIKERIRADKKKANAQRKREADRAQRRAANGWRQCDPHGESEYLKKKGVLPHGVRFTPKGNMVIPIHDSSDRVHGLQVIYSDPAMIKKKGRDRDYWPSGLAKQGNYFLIGAPTWLVIVAEGYATAATVHEAGGWPVAVAFDANNLQPVCQALRKRYPRAKILVAADDDFLCRCQHCKKQTPVTEPKCQHCGEDHGKTNTGVRTAKAAAFAVDGSWVIPRFADRGTAKLTDFNDLAMHPDSGANAVRNQIEQKIHELGWYLKNAALTTQQGEAGKENDFVFGLDSLLDRFALIYGTETVFDERLRRIISLSSLRAAVGNKQMVRYWLEHPGRRIVLPEQVIFDPTAPLDTPDLCNLWGGWPTKARSGSCERLLELLKYLCEAEDNPEEVYRWILKWLAYPISHPGTKMQTALLVHGPEGAGKNTFFGVIRQIYERYGGIFDQTQLESQFNGWASGKLFMIGNEVVTRVELYHQQGRLKNMITEQEWQINEKNLPTRLEQNHCNFVFFSNRVDIAKLDPKDRRYCVVWTPEALPEDYYIDVAEEIRDGGIEALHHHLKHEVVLDGFHAHTKPPSTKAKRDLQELGMDSIERFWRDWHVGDVPVPCVPCRSEDLYELYRYWAQKEGVPRAAPRYVLLGNIGKKRGVKRGPAHYFNQNGKKCQHRFIWPFNEHADPPPGETQIQHLTNKIREFQAAMEEWMEK